MLLAAMLLAQFCSGNQCLSDGTQSLYGFKYLESGMCSMEDAYFNKRIVAYPGKQLQVLGARPANDTAPAVVLGNEVRRDAGAALEIRRGPDVADRLMVVDSETGNAILACETGATTRTCTWLDGSGISGHWSLSVMPGYYVTIAGRLAENHTNTTLDGGCNMSEPDGGCYASFTALHGELTVVSSEARPFGGWGLQYSNPVTDGTGPNRWFVDVWGGMGQRHLMIRAQFPKCPADIELTTPQTQLYFNGAIESTLLWAFDEHRYHVCDGAQWTHLDGEPCP